MVAGAAGAAAGVGAVGWVGAAAGDEAAGEAGAEADGGLRAGQDRGSLDRLTWPARSAGLRSVTRRKRAKSTL